MVESERLSDEFFRHCRLPNCFCCAGSGFSSFIIVLRARAWIHPTINPQWERQVLEKIALASLAGQTAPLGIFFKLAGLAYLVPVLAVPQVVDWRGEAYRRQTYSSVNVRGTIEATSDASAERINGALQSAFEDKGTAGIVLRISSPGGSPVQAGIVYDEIRRLRAKFRISPCMQSLRICVPPVGITLRLLRTRYLLIKPVSLVR